jgi:hypothetical protein
MSTTHRKKPVEVEARQWDGTAAGAAPIIDWVLSSGGTANYDCASDGCRGEDEDHVIFIQTLEGRMATSPGDWVIRGVEGEFYPCKDSVFQATYDKVGEAEGATGEVDVEIVVTAPRGRVSVMATISTEQVQAGGDPVVLATVQRTAAAMVRALESRGPGSAL